MRDYRLISADSHVNEPPDLWQTRVPAKFEDRAPRMESFPKGDAWILEGSPNPVPFRRNACAGMTVWAGEGGPYMRWADVRPSASDPAERLKDQDLDGVDAELLFPTPSIQSSIASNPDAEFQLALVQAYNDWMSEYCSHDPDRLFGLALLPNRGVDAAVAEFERVMQLPAIRTAMIALYPHGTKQILPEDDRLWGAFASAGVPLTLHVGLNDAPPPGTDPNAPEVLPAGVVRYVDATQRLHDFIYTGVMSRFPALQVLFAETDAGWFPCWKEQAYNRWMRQSPTLRASAGLTEPPTSFAERMHFTYITDTFAIRHREEVGVRQLLWSSDYPHSESDYPHSWRTIRSDFLGVPEEDQQLILAGNCLRLLGIS
jgi:predicted TIM-barrel fold metal-dependent hydrolase